MEAITRSEIVALGARGCAVMIGNDMTKLLYASTRLDGPTLLVEMRDPVLDGKGKVLETEAFTFTSVRDGEMVASVGFSRSQPGSLKRLWDNKWRKWSLDTAVSSLGLPPRA